MRMTIALLTLGLLQVQAKSFSQNITFSGKNIPLEHVFSEIEKQTGFVVFYDYREISGAKKVSVNARSTPLRSFLDHCFSNQPFGFVIEDKTIMITRKKNGNDIIASSKEINQTIKGVVKDGKGIPLPGASVHLSPGNRGTSTNNSGFFELRDVPEGKYTLEISFIGHQTLTRSITVGAAPIELNNIVLLDDENKLTEQEVVVNGYNRTEKRKLTSSIVSLKTEDMPSVSQTSIDKMLQGMVPGMSVLMNSGEPGAVPIVKIRGTSTLTGNANPLWVVDGVILEDPVPLSPAEINSPDIINRIGNATSFINPQDIETITILKDASATAIYGVKAAGGVVVLTTKKGKRSAAIVNVNSSTSVTPKPSYSRFNLMNSKERVDVESYYLNEEATYYNADANVNSVGLSGAYARYKNRNISTWEEFEEEVRKAQTYNTDWFDVLFRNAVTTNNNINVSGGGDNSTYYVSFSALNQQGPDLLTDYSRYNGMMKLNTSLSPNLNAEFFLSGNSSTRSSYPYSLVPPGISNFTRATPRPFDYAINTSRTFPLLNPDGSYYMYRGHNDQYLFNVMNEYDNSDQTTKTNGYTARVSLDYRITNNLRAFVLLDYTTSNSLNETYYTDATNQVAGIRRSEFGETPPDDSNLPKGGIIFSNSNFQDYYMGRASLSYNPVSTGKHELEFMGGGEYRSNSYRGDNTTGWGYLHDRGRTIVTSQNIAEELSGAPYMRISDYARKYASYFGVASYTYNRKYTVNFNSRFDGSNLFGSNPKYRWKPAWSVSGRWNMLEENFLRGSSFFNNLAMRGSYGIQGSVNEQSTPQIVASFLPPAYWSGLDMLTIEQPTNPNLRWEKTYQSNLGLDFSLLKSRIFGAVDVYRRKSVDLIINTRISEVNGFSYLPINFADVTNNGVEFGLSVVPVRKNKFSWTSTINFSYNKNEVTKVNLEPNVTRMLSAFPYKPDAAIVGKPLNSLYSVPFAGVNPQTGVAQFLMAKGDTTVGRSGLQFGLEDLVYSGAMEAPYTGGFNNLIEMGNFKLSLLFTYGFGNKLRMNPILASWMYAPDQNLSAELNDAWKEPGDVTNVPHILNETGSNNHKSFWNQSDYRVISGNYGRLRNATLQYFLPQTFVRRLGISKARVQLEGNNLVLIADKRLYGFDPETMVYNSLPNLSSFLIGLNVTF